MFQIDTAEGILCLNNFIQCDAKTEALAYAKRTSCYCLLVFITKTDVQKHGCYKSCSVCLHSCIQLFTYL